MGEREILGDETGGEEVVVAVFKRWVEGTRMAQ